MRILKGIIAALLTVAATAASAQNPFTPVSGDLSVLLLGKLFGGLVGNGGADPLKDLISTFNGAILAVGGVLVAYTIFAGTIGTAHDGQMLGKKFSSVWVPIRTALGTALVIPINGYCGMQMLVMWLVLQGVGLADSVWSSLVQGDALMTGTIQASSYKSPETIALANSIAKASICVHAAQTHANINNTGDSWGVYQVNNIIFYGIKDSFMRKATCGEVKLLEETEQAASKVSGDFSNVAETVGKTASTLPIIRAQNEATKSMVAEIFSATKGFVVSSPTGNTQQVLARSGGVGDLSPIVEAYNNKVSQAVIDYYKTNDESGKAVKENAVKEGWLTAGAWFIKLSSQMSKANVALSSTPTAISSGNIFGWDFEEVNRLLSQVEGELANNKINQKSGIARQNTLDAGSQDTFTAVIGRWIGKFMTSFDISEVGNQTNVHPIIQMKAMGDKLVSSAIISITTLISVWTAGALGLSAGSVALGGGITGAAQAAGTIALGAALFITPIAFSVFGSFLTLGFFLSYYIPMIPFLIWLGCIIGWFILVMEAVIAAPLWAVMHLHPNGDDMTGKGGQGYMLVLGLLIRPTLLIFGLACSLILSMVVGQLVNSLFYEVFTMSRNGDTVGLVGTILAYVLYTVVMLTFTKKMFSVIHFIPDQILRWVGGGSAQLGEFQGAMVQGTEGQFMKAGALFGALGQQGLTSGLSSLQNAARGKEDKAHKASNQAGRLGFTLNQVDSMAQRGEGGLSSIQALDKLSAAQNSIKAMGGSGADIGKFNDRVASSDKPLGEAIRDGLEQFKTDTGISGESSAPTVDTEEEKKVLDQLDKELQEFEPRESGSSLLKENNNSEASAARQSPNVGKE